MSSSLCVPMGRRITPLWVWKLIAAPMLRWRTMKSTIARTSGSLAGYSPAPSWIADAPEPAGFLRALVGCAARRADQGEVNISGFCDRGLDSAIDHDSVRPNSFAEFHAGLESYLERIWPGRSW